LRGSGILLDGWCNGSSEDPGRLDRAHHHTPLPPSPPSSLPPPLQHPFCPTSTNVPVPLLSPTHSPTHPPTPLPPPNGPRLHGVHLLGDAVAHAVPAGDEQGRGVGRVFRPHPRVLGFGRPWRKIRRGRNNTLPLPSRPQAESEAGSRAVYSLVRRLHSAPPLPALPSPRPPLSSHTPRQRARLAAVQWTRSSTTKPSSTSTTRRTRRVEGRG
jgi:hypothetical protein